MNSTVVCNVIDRVRQAIPRLRSGLLFVLLTATSVSAAEPILAINEDNGHFFGYHKREEMNIRGLHKWVDQYANGAVTHLFICPNAMRATFRSKTREAIWDPVNGKTPQLKLPWPRHAKLLHDKGIDPYKVWIARCRKKRIKVFLSMRMNDIHQAEDFNNYQHSSFWRKNVRFWRRPNHEHGSELNYAYKEVRQFQMAFVRELLERYDPDGIELDWMRFPSNLTPGKAFQERGILTQFVREVRELTKNWSKKRGHKIELSVRAPAHPDAGPGRGMDAITWARQGLVDIIVASPFYFSTDFDIPFELWRKRLNGNKHKVTIIGGVESTARPWLYGTPVGNSLETLRGFASSTFQRGSQGVYLFNWMSATKWPVPRKHYDFLLARGLSKKVLTTLPRRYPVCFHDTVPKGFDSGTQLPAAAKPGKTFRLHLGPKPRSGKVWAIAGLPKRAGLADAKFAAKLNGQPIQVVADLNSTKELGGKSARGIRFECPVNAVRSGYNQLEIRQISGKPQQFVWVEIRIDPR